jgi:hypothetical protein
MYDSLSQLNLRGARASDKAVLQRSDRVVTLPPGIPSGLVPIITPSGDVAGLVGAGGALTSPRMYGGKTIMKVFWRTL